MKFACLTYHVIGNSDSQYSVADSQLRDHLTFLDDQGYYIDDFEGLEARLVSKQNIADRYAVVSIDDGHESSMKAADLLQTYGCRATFFVTRDRCLKKPNFIREPHIRELRRGGFSVGTHGTSHRKLTRMPLEACITELNESKRWLEQVLGEQVRHMAAPGGYINNHLVRLAYSSGYTLVGTCKEWMNSFEKMMILPNKVNRVNVRRHFSLRTLRQAIEGHTGFYFRRRLRSAALALPKQFLR